MCVRPFQGLGAVPAYLLPALPLLLDDLIEEDTVRDSHRSAVL